MFIRDRLSNDFLGECCGRVFEHKKLLLGHIAAKHNQELMVPCRFCSRTFSRNDVKETHEREIHNNSQSSPYFQCNECDSAFDMRDDLMSHKILTHYTGNIHACGECGKSFKKKSLLDIHMSTHKEKSIQCESCKMMFTFMSGLNKHRKLGRCKGPQMEKTKHTPEEVARIAKEQLDEITVNPKKAEKEENVFRDLQVPESIEIVKVEARAARRLSFKDDLKDLEAKEDTEYFTITTFGIEEKEKYVKILLHIHSDCKSFLYILETPLALNLLLPTKKSSKALADESSKGNIQ